MPDYLARIRVLIYFVFLMVGIGAACADGEIVESNYVSLADDNCFQPPSDTRLYANNSLGVVECRVKNTAIRLFVVSSEERSWIDIVVGDTRWSTEDPIVYAKENQFGYFPNVGVAPVELLVNQKKIPVGLIFRVTAQDPNQKEQGSANISRLFALGFRKEGVCFLGLTDSNIAARSLVQTNTICRQMLQSSRFIQSGS